MSERDEDLEKKVAAVKWTARDRGSGDEPRDYGALSERKGINLAAERDRIARENKTTSAVYDGWKYR
jgi:hypothetical protein